MNLTRITPTDLSYKRLALAIIVGFSAIRGVIAFSMELGTDEAYYWFYSQNIKWNYFDHPPMVAVWVRFFTGNPWLQHIEGFVRLGSVIGCGLSSWAIYKTGETIHSPRSGLFGVCLYNASIYASVTAGIFIMPDAPQMVFYTVALWMVARIAENEKDRTAWIAFGLAAGLCIMSKVYGVFLWTGLVAFATIKRRHWFRQPGIYIALLLTAIVCSPILIWNLQHDFLTYKFHSARADISSGGFNVITFFREATNQVLYNNPVNVIAISMALIAFFKHRKAAHDPRIALKIFSLIGLPLAVLLLILSFFRDTTLPHWSGPAYVALIPMTAVYLADKTSRFAKRLLFVSTTFFVLFLIGWQFLIHHVPETISSNNVDRRFIQLKSQTLKTLFSGFENFQLIAETKNSWEKADDAFLELYQRETRRGGMGNSVPVVCYKWWGAHIEYYFCHANKIPMIGLGKPDELHEYLFMNSSRRDKVSLKTAYCIVPADDSYDVGAKYSTYYENISSPSVISVKRNGKPDVQFYVYRLSGWKNVLPMVID